jgi:hypothetical protein
MLGTAWHKEAKLNKQKIAVFTIEIMKGIL